MNLLPSYYRPLFFLLFFVQNVVVVSFVQKHNNAVTFHRKKYNEGSPSSSSSSSSSSIGAQDKTQEISVFLDMQLTDEKVTSLFAWVSRAFAGEGEYNNLMLAIAAIFGNLPKDSDPVQMAEKALKLLPPEEECVGDLYSIEEREDNSLGAMGAAQWTGQWKTRPHALLELKNITTIDDWVKTLPRGCKRTIKKALAQDFTVTTKSILGDKPAPHSSLAHFRCVIAHEVRLLTNMHGDEGFLNALAEGVSRYVGTTHMTGDIREYRNATTGAVIAIAHEVRKTNKQNK